jgi:hypothetical protein
VDAVAVMPPEDLADASAPHRAAALRKAAPSELLFMLKRYDDENPPQQSRLDVIRTCIMAAYPDAVANDARYQSAMRWFWSLEAGRRELRRRPERREQALRRARARLGSRRSLTRSRRSRRARCARYGNATVAAAAAAATEATCVLDIVVTRRCRAQFCVPRGVWPRGGANRGQFPVLCWWNRKYP